MRASELFAKPVNNLQKPIRQYRNSINAPYKHHDFLTLAVTLFLLLAVPMTVIIAMQARDVRKSAAGPEESEVKKQEIEFVSNEILIKVKKGADNKIKSKPKPNDTGIASLNNLNKSQKATKFEKSFKTNKKTKNKNHEIFRWFKVTLPGKKEVVKEEVGGEKSTKLKSVSAKYKKNPNVEETQLNFISHATSLPNDTYIDPDPDDDVWSTGAWGQTYEDMWGLKKIQADQAWDFVGDNTLGQGVTIAVVDSGVDYNHDDIENNIWINPGEDLNSNGVVDGTDTCPTPSGDFNCIDDDGNGFIDDIRGWDFIGNDNNPSDFLGHGTHVSGTAAAEGNNGVGISGVAPKASVMPVRSLNSSGNGTSQQFADGIRYAAENGAKVINNSWGCFGGVCPNDLIVEDGVKYAYDEADAVVVFSAGNVSGQDVSFSSPHNMTEVIAVAASDENDNPTGFTSTGFDVDVAAPGGGAQVGPPPDQSVDNILSLLSANGSCNALLIVGTNYCRLKGTSMAAPHVAGLAALIREKHPEFTNEQVRQALRVSADDISDPGFDVNSGHGRINVPAALAVDSPLQVKISAPTRVTNINGVGTVRIEGTAAGTGFESYSLSYGVGHSPSSFIQISGPHTTPVTDGTLGTLDESSLAVNRYIIKLSAVAGGVTYENHVLVLKENSNPLIVQPGTQQWPEVDGDKVVWEDFRGGTLPDIFVYDFSTDKEKNITNDTSFEKRTPVVSGDKVVWEDWRGNQNIFLYDMHKNTTGPIIDDDAFRITPDISGNKVVFRESNFGVPAHIQVYDLETGIKTQITSDQTSQPSQPAISGNRIVWKDGRNSSDDIYFFDLDNPGAGEIQVTSSNQHQRFPDIFGDKIVFDENGKIFMYDIPSSNTTRISNPSCQLLFGCGATVPSIYGDRVVWSDWRDVTTDVWLYDIGLGEEQIVTTDLDYQSSPVISATKIVWRDERTGSRDLFYADIPGNNAPVIKLLDSDLNNDGSVVIGDILEVVACFGTTETQPDDFVPPWVPACDLNVDGSVTIGDIVLVVGNFGTIGWPPFNSIGNPVSAFTTQKMQFFLRVTDPDGAPQPSLNVIVRDVTDPGNPVSVDFTTDLGGTFTASIGPIFTRGEIVWEVPKEAGKTYEFTFTADDGTDTTDLILYIEVI